MKFAPRRPRTRVPTEEQKAEEASLLSRITEARAILGAAIAAANVALEKVVETEGLPSRVEKYQQRAQEQQRAQYDVSLLEYQLEQHRWASTGVAPKILLRHPGQRP